MSLFHLTLQDPKAKFRGCLIQYWCPLVFVEALCKAPFSYKGMFIFYLCYYVRAVQNQKKWSAYVEYYGNIWVCFWNRNNNLIYECRWSFFSVIEVKLSANGMRYFFLIPLVEINISNPTIQYYIKTSQTILFLNVNISKLIKTTLYKSYFI